MMDNISYSEIILKSDQLKQEIDDLSLKSDQLKQEINDLSVKLNETKTEQYLLNKLLTEKEMDTKLWNIHIDQKDKTEMVEYINKKIFFSIPEKLLNKYSNIIKSNKIGLHYPAIQFFDEFWETIKDSEDPKELLHKFTTTDITHICQDHVLKYNSRTLVKCIEPIKNYINECLPFEVYYLHEGKCRFFIPERLKKKGFSIIEVDKPFNGPCFHIYLNVYSIFV